MTCTLLCCIIMLEAAIWWVNCGHNGMHVVSNNIQMAFKHCSTGIKTPSVYQKNHTITPPPVWNVDRRYFGSTYSDPKICSIAEIKIHHSTAKMYFQGVFSSIFPLCTYLAPGNLMWFFCDLFPFNVFYTLCLSSEAWLLEDIWWAIYMNTFFLSLSFQCFRTNVLLSTVHIKHSPVVKPSAQRSMILL